MSTPVRAITTVCNLTTIPTLHVDDTIVSLDALGDMFAYIETEDATIEYVFIHPSRAKELVRNMTRKRYTKKELYCIGHVWGVPVHITSKVDKNTVVAVGTPNWGNAPLECVRVIFQPNNWWTKFKKKLKVWFKREV